MPHQCTNCGRAFADGSKEMLSGCPDCGGNKFQFRPEGTVGDDGPGTPDESDASDASTDAPDASTDAPDAPTDDADARADAGTGPAARAGAAVRDWVGLGDEGDADARGEDDIIVAGNDPPASPADAEDSAQASARGDVVSDDELAAVSEDAATDPESRDPPAADDARPTDDPEATPAAGGTGTDVDVDAESDDAGGVPGDDVGADDRPGLDELREELNEQFESIRIVSPGQYELNLMELYDREEYIISLQEDGRYVIEVPDRWGESADDDE